MDKAGLKTYILQDIKRRTVENPIYSYELEERYHVSGVAIREAVHELRVIDNAAVCSGNKGYYIARDKSEALRTVAHLKSRAKRNIDAAEVILKHYEEESGQINLL